MHYKIKIEAAPHHFVDVDFHEGDAVSVGLLIQDLQIKVPGRYVAEEVEAPEPQAVDSTPKRRSKAPKSE